MRYIRFPLGCVMGCLLFLCSCNDSRQSEVLQQALKKAGVKVTLESDSPLASTFPVLVSPAPVTSVGAPPSNKPSAVPSPLATTIVPTPILIPSSTPTPLPRPEDITYDVSTFAGQFEPEVLKRTFIDGNLVTSRFVEPSHIVVSKDNIYVVDGDRTIRKISVSTSGSSVSTLVGNDKFIFAESQDSYNRSNRISSIVAAPQGGVYIAYLNSVQHIDNTGHITIVIGDATPGYVDGPKSQAKLNQPNGLAVNKAGELYVADSGNYRIRKLTLDAQVITVAGNGTSGSKDGSAKQARLSFPTSIAFDSQDNLYMYDQNSLRVLDNTGLLRTFSLYYTLPVWTHRKIPSLSFLGDITVGLNGDLYVADLSHHWIRRIRFTNNNNAEVFVIAGVGEVCDQVTLGCVVNGDASQSFFYGPSGLSTDKNGNIYVADSGHGVIRKLTPKPIKPES